MKNILVAMYDILIEIKRFLLGQYGKKHYSLEGEDIILNNLLPSKRGFYIDIGAHHPLRFSNTYLLYKRGWKGINIDALPGSMKLFELYRSRDLNLEIGIGAHRAVLDYYQFDEPAVNTFSEKLAKENVKQGYTRVRKTRVRVFPLKDILKQYRVKKIDVLTIDVEGLDLEVLKSNNWSLYRPQVVIVEDAGFKFENIHMSKIYKYMQNNGYHLVAVTGNSTIYKG